MAILHGGGREREKQTLSDDEGVFDLGASSLVGGSFLREGQVLHGDALLPAYVDVHTRQASPWTNGSHENN